MRVAIVALAVVAVSNVASAPIASYTQDSVSTRSLSRAESELSTHSGFDVQSKTIEASHSTASLESRGAGGTANAVLDTTQALGPKLGGVVGEFNVPIGDPGRCRLILNLSRCVKGLID